MLTVDSKIKELFANEEAYEICQKYGWEFESKKAKMTHGMTLRALAKFPQTGCTPEKLEALNNELVAANLE